MKFRYFILFFSIFLTHAAAADFYSFTVEDQKGEEISLEKYRGKVS